MISAEYFYYYGDHFIYDIARLQSINQTKLISNYQFCYNLKQALSTQFAPYLQTNFFCYEKNSFIADKFILFYYRIF